MQSTREFSLFIADLDASNTEEEIMQFFTQQLGNQDALYGVKVCYDHNNPSRSLRYGFLNFKSAEILEKALETLNYKKIGNAKKYYRLARYQGDSSVRKSGVGNVIFKNLPISWSGEHAKLSDLASTAGETSSVIVSDHHGPESSHGYVQFKNEEEANKAIAELNGKEVEGKTIVVEHAIRMTNFKHNEIFISGFPKEITPDELKQILSQFGTVTQVDSRDSLPKYGHYAYVWFETEEEAQKSVTELNGKPIRPEQDAEQKTNVSIYYVRREREAYKKKLREETRFQNLYIRGFPSWYDNDDLKKLFEGFGQIKSCVVMKNDEGISKGFGFCCFADKAAAGVAYSEMNGKKIPSQKPDEEEQKDLETELYVNYAQPKEEREAQQNNRGKSHNTAHSMYGKNQHRQRPGGKAPMPQFPPAWPFFPPSPYPFSFPQPASPQSQYPYRGYPNLQSPPNVPVPNQAYFNNPIYARQNAARARAPYPAMNPQMAMYMRGMQFPFMQPQMRGMPMYPSPVQANPSGGSPLPAYIGAGSPSSTAQSTGSPAGAPMGDQMGSPAQLAQTSSPKSTGQPGTPTSSSMPTTPESGATASMGGSPYSQPNLGPITLDKQTLANMSDEEQRTTIGEHLFHRINNIDNTNAGKITGMLLELDMNELVHLLEDPNELRAKVQEAQGVLRDATASQQQQ